MNFIHSISLLIKALGEVGIIRARRDYAVTPRVPRRISLPRIYSP